MIQLWTVRSPHFSEPCHHGDYPNPQQAAQAARSLVWTNEDGEYREVVNGRTVKTTKIPAGDKRPQRPKSGLWSQWPKPPEPAPQQEPWYRRQETKDRAASAAKTAAGTASFWWNGGQKSTKPKGDKPWWM